MCSGALLVLLIVLIVFGILCAFIRSNVRRHFHLMDKTVILIILLLKFIHFRLILYRKFNILAFSMNAKAVNFRYLEFFRFIYLTLYKLNCFAPKYLDFADSWNCVCFTWCVGFLNGKWCYIDNTRVM